MQKSVVPIEVKAVLPTSGGCAVFLGNDEKVFVIYVDQAVGAAITMFMHHTPKPRPQTHDLFADVLTALGAHVERMVINDFNESVYYARLIIVASNEIDEKKIVEIDARPSDGIALAIQQKAPMYVASHVWDQVEDMSEILQKMGEKGFQGGGLPDFPLEEPDESDD
ncbi:MAG: bifunctional nuclease family protein [Verrucomicrobiae bacterium]|nr:bifunctional nuclease family protein [Verrucomicrobiae bacterium]MCB1235656.1 bifunctional nuclease family protein [Verrucomicrobiae bacterium]MCP5540058.1 bifunctional nuclease family protein [Akkermansiaceae bacterium]MCP5549991.1 bifunctional nuclease family protein [Akkermansiaceae bacterium]